MRFIVFSDIHFYKNPSKSYITDWGYSSWLIEQLRIVDQILDFAKEYNIQYVIHNGDLFEEKNRIPQDLYNTVWMQFKNYSKDFKIILNTGNHDRILKREYSSLQPFSDICTVVDKPTDYIIDDIFMRIIPYGMLDGNLGLPKEKYKSYLLFTHEDIAGLKHGSMDYTSSSPYKHQIFGDWTYVFNGHIHKPQELVNIINIGSPMIQDWGEKDEQKRFIYYEDDHITPVSIECPQFYEIDKLNDGIKERIENDNRNFYRISISPEQLGDDIFKRFNAQPNIIKKEVRKIRFRDERSDELEQYMEIMGVPENLDRNYLLKIGRKISHNK